MSIPEGSLYTKDDFTFSGEAIAKGEQYTGTVEGIFALRGLIRRAEKLGVKTPVLIEMRDKMGL